MRTTVMLALLLATPIVSAARQEQSAFAAGQLQAAIDDLQKPRDYARQRSAAERLAKLGPSAAPAVPALIGVLRQPFERVGGDVMSPVPGYLEAIDAAKLAIRKIGPTAIPALIDGLQDPPGSLHIVELLGEMDDPRVVAPLVGALGGPAGWKAQELLIKMVAPGVADAVAARLTDPSEQVRHEAMLTLVGRRDPRALPPVEKILAGSDQYKRMEAVGYLATLRPPDVRDRLQVLMKDADASVRFRAAERLGEVGDRRDVPAIIAALGDSASQVRWAAASSLGKLKDGRALAPLQAALKVETEGASRQAMEEAIRLIRGGR
jgi:HEAT repeat protein